MQAQVLTARRSAPAPELPVALDMPGKVANFLRSGELDDVDGPRSTRA
ncbi:hypothetical protein ACFYO5_24315 [Streptomyces sp. NPDC006259]